METEGFGVGVRFGRVEKQVRGINTEDAENGKKERTRRRGVRARIVALARFKSKRGPSLRSG